ncbi:MAG: FAD-dependent oxidoreductase [Thermaerobacter sp.]|nr:FAD-dependent oxidoreductase [Thermaerobacter sp.]
MVVGEFTENADVVIIGGGAGGIAAAIRAAQLGRSVTVVEAADIGEVSLNSGSTASQALISQAARLWELTAGDGSGIRLGLATLDWPFLQNWKNERVWRAGRELAKRLAAYRVRIEKGYARFIGDGLLRVVGEHESKRLRFAACVIATGSRPRTLKALASDGRVVIDATQALSLPEIPHRLLVVGAGCTGLELGMAYCKFGSQVTMVDTARQLLPGTEPEIVRVLQRRLRELKVALHLESEAVQLVSRPDGGTVLLSTPAGLQSIDTDRTLVTVGRIPNTDDLGLEQTGIGVDSAGFLLVNDRMQTQNPLIYAIGDVVGVPMSAHKAGYEGKVAAEAIAGMPSGRDALAVAAVIFTDPEIAVVGMTATQAARDGYGVTTASLPYAGKGRAIVVAERETDRVLGVHIAGPEASTVISEAALAIEMGATLTDLALTVHPHPTRAEILTELAEVALRQIDGRQNLSGQDWEDS